MPESEPRVLVGQPVYDDEGTEIGTIRGVIQDGFEVATGEGIEAMSVAHSRAGHEIGRGVLTWQCAQCGAIGDIESLPERCPDCGAPPEEIYYRQED